MKKSSVYNDFQNSIGQRVRIRNQYGTLRYFGSTNFAHGLWCGIELDEAVGENDGKINNVSYFTCKENYGIFIPASETDLVNDDASENNLKVSTLLAEDFNSPEETSDVDFKTQKCNIHSSFLLDGSQPVLPKDSSQKTMLNESYIISKGYYTDELSIIGKETFENICQDSVSFSIFDSKADFIKCENFPSTEEFLEQEGISSSPLVNQESEMPYQDLEGKYDSDESLGILPDHLIDEISLDSLVLDANNPNTDLNTTVILSNTLNESPAVSTEHYTIELLNSPIWIMPKASSFTKNDESPIYNPTSTPKYASTPKHETNFSYVIEDDSAQNISCGFQPNNVLEKIEGNEKYLEFALHDKASPEYISPLITNTLTSVTDEKKDPENSLNVTCNILNPLDTIQSPLNRTFDNMNVTVDKKATLPLAESKGNKQSIQSHAVNVLRTDYNLFLQHRTLEESDAVPSDIHPHEEQEKIYFESQNVLNRTCDIVKTSNTNVIKNVDEDENPENQKGIALNVLNTTVSLPGELENKSEEVSVEENIGLCDKADILNTTYEKIDESSALLTGIKPLHLSKQCVTKYNKNVKTSQTDSKGKSKKIISFPKSDSISLKEESENKCPAFDRKKNQRKSVGGFGRTNISAESKNKQAQNRRNSFASNTYTSSKSDETMIKGPTDDKSMSTDGSFKENTNGNDKSNKDLIDPSLNSKILSGKTEEAKLFTEVKLKASQKSLLDETINLTSPTPDIGKTVIKKPKFSFNFPKSMIPTNEKKFSQKIPTTAETKGTYTLFSKPSLKKPSVVSAATVGEKHTTRLPTKQVLSQKNICTSIPSSSANTGNVARSRSIVPAPKSINNQEIGQTSASSNTGYNLARKVNLNDTILISGHQSSSEQGVKLASKAATHIPLSQSKISSVPQGKKKGDDTVKSSLIPRRKESTSRKFKSPSQYNLR